jgi:hypothetical protein
MEGYGSILALVYVAPGPAGVRNRLAGPLR